jgi:hypothetical protein
VKWRGWSKVKYQLSRFLDYNIRDSYDLEEKKRDIPPKPKLRKTVLLVLN